MDVPPNLLDAAQRKLAKLDAFVDESGWIEVGFVEEKNPRIADKYHCEIVAHVKGHRLKVEGSAAEPLGALDRATEKVEKQVVRLKDKRVKRRIGRREANLERAAANGAVPPEATSRHPSRHASGTRVAGDALPAIVERAETESKPMTPVEAAMQLGVLREDFLLFVNADTGRAAVVYRHRGGDYGLVELPA